MDKVEKYTFKELEKDNTNKSNENINLLSNIPTKIDFFIGNSTTTIAELLNLKKGSLLKIENNNSKIEIDVSVQGKLLGKGEVVLIDNEPYVRITKIN